MVELGEVVVVAGEVVGVAADFVPEGVVVEVELLDEGREVEPAPVTVLAFVLPGNAAPRATDAPPAAASNAAKSPKVMRRIRIRPRSRRARASLGLAARCLVSEGRGMSKKVRNLTVIRLSTG